MSREDLSLKITEIIWNKSGNIAPERLKDLVVELLTMYASVDVIVNTEFSGIRSAVSTSLMDRFYSASSKEPENRQS